eukprot:243031-Amphidinium_carterae.1
MLEHPLLRCAASRANPFIQPRYVYTIGCASVAGKVPTVDATGTLWHMLSYALIDRFSSVH